MIHTVCVQRRLGPVILIVAVLTTSAYADNAASSSKLAKESLEASTRTHSPGKNKLCCGYPMSENLGYALRFYWLAMQDRYADDFTEVDIYTPRGLFLGSFPQPFVRALRMEGSGLLSDGRVLNYAGRCRFGTGTCYEPLDVNTHPFGRGAGRRALVPFRSVAVDRTIIPLGDPLYIPEFDGLMMPDGTIHDGCVRADDTGGGIKKRKIDFFVVSYPNFRFLLAELWNVIWITPHIEPPRCQYLRPD